LGVAEVVKKVKSDKNYDLELEIFEEDCMAVFRKKNFIRKVVYTKEGT